MTLILALVMLRILLKAQKVMGTTKLTVDKSKPLYLQNPAEKPSIPVFLLMDEVITTTDYRLFKSDSSILYRLPKNLIGSRSDVRVLIRHANGGWTLMPYRPLDTDHEADLNINAATILRIPTWTYYKSTVHCAF